MTDANKAKIAKRVIEVFEFFDEKHPEATVMGIARRYDWPQSSTSELLANLVDLGLLYKNSQTRTYTLTPRAAMLGCNVQPSIVRSGRLFTLLDRLADHQTSHDVGLLGLVNLDAQVFASRCGEGPKGGDGHLGIGQKERLSQTAAGWLLLSTMPQKWREAMIRRLNADALEDRKFNFSEMCERVNECQENGFAIGPAGFGSAKQMCAILLPSHQLNQPMALSLSYNSTPSLDVNALVDGLMDTMAAVLSDSEDATRSISTLDRIAVRLDHGETRNGRTIAPLHAQRSIGEKAVARVG